jgi:hypothetical protein
MNKIAVLLLLVSLLSSCSKQDKNAKKFDNKDNSTENIQTSVVHIKSEAELLLDKSLLEAYVNKDYAKCLEILQEGSDGRIDYLKPNYPLLFDICHKYLNDAEKSPGIESLLDYYLKNRKAAFEDSIEGTYPDEIKERINPKQTVGSYLARFSTIELLRRIAQEKININSPGEYIGDYSIPAIYELIKIDRNTEKKGGFRGRYFRDWKINIEEKKIRIELLLDAGADVTLVDNIFGTQTIFTLFRWYPFEEDYAKLLNKMTEKGADLFYKNRDGKSCIYHMLDNSALDSNTEVYLEYVISHGLHVTEIDLYQFAEQLLPYMKSDKVTETELRRLEKIKKILENDAKSTGLSYDDAWEYGNNYTGKSITSD